MNECHYCNWYETLTRPNRDRWEGGIVVTDPKFGDLGHEKPIPANDLKLLDPQQVAKFGGGRAIFLFGESGPPAELFLEKIAQLYEPHQVHVVASEATLESWRKILDGTVGEGCRVHPFEPYLVEV